MKEVVIIRDETLTFDLQHTLIPACQRWGGTRWSHDRSVVSESVGDYVEQGVIKDTPQPNRMKRDRWLTGLCLDSVEQEQNKCSSRSTSTLSALPKECEEAEFLTKETCLISVCVCGGDIAKLAHQKPELQWHVANQKPDTLEVHWRTGAPRSSADVLYSVPFAPPPLTEFKCQHSFHSSALFFPVWSDRSWSLVEGKKCEAKGLQQASVCIILHREQR